METVSTARALRIALLFQCFVADWAAVLVIDDWEACIISFLIFTMLFLEFFASNSRLAFLSFRILHLNEPFKLTIQVGG